MSVSAVTMFAFAGAVYALPPCYDRMKPLLSELESALSSDCAGRYYRTIARVAITPWMANEQWELDSFGTIVPVGPHGIRKSRGEPVLYMRCFYPSRMWTEMSSAERREAIGAYMIECKIAARRWLDKRKEILDSEKFERDFARALDRFRAGTPDN